MQPVAQLQQRALMLTQYQKPRWQRFPQYSQPILVANQQALAAQYPRPVAQNRMQQQDQRRPLPFQGLYHQPIVQTPQLSLQPVHYPVSANQQPLRNPPLRGLGPPEPLEFLPNPANQWIPAGPGAEYGWHMNWPPA